MYIKIAFKATNVQVYRIIVVDSVVEVQFEAEVTKMIELLWFFLMNK